MWGFSPLILIFFHFTFSVAFCFSFRLSPANSNFRPLYNSQVTTSCTKQTYPPPPPPPPIWIRLCNFLFICLFCFGSRRQRRGRPLSQLAGCEWVLPPTIPRHQTSPVRWVICDLMKKKENTGTSFNMCPFYYWKANIQIESYNKITGIMKDCDCLVGNGQRVYYTCIGLSSCCHRLWNNSSHYMRGWIVLVS